MSTVSSKGQVTVPQEIRNRLGLKEGDRLEFVVEGDHTIVRPARGDGNPFLAYAGARGTLPGTAHEIAAWIHELRDDDETPPPKP